MKKLLVLFAALTFVTVAVAQDDANKINFEKTTHNFGKIPQGIPATYQFSFTNNQNEPIMIEGVTASCGCTAPDWTKSPILPGQKGFVSAKYNAAGMGGFHKNVTVNYKIGSQSYSIKLNVEGEVVQPESVPEKKDNLLKN